MLILAIVTIALYFGEAGYEIAKYDGHQSKPASKGVLFFSSCILTSLGVMWVIAIARDWRF